MRLPKPVALTAAVALSAFTLSACTPSPTPDEALQTLYQDARHDSEALLTSSPEFSALRAEQAEEVATEIKRLCGYTDEGALPESCALQIPTVAAAPAADAAQHIRNSQAQLLKQLDTIPEESLPLITAHYIEQARLAPASEEITVPAELSLEDEVDLGAAQGRLAEEYAAAWALGVALAHVSPEYQEATQAAIDQHRDYAALLRSTIQPFAETSPSEATYDLGELSDPVDPASALQLISEVQDHALEAWHSTASSAIDPGWRSLATQIAGATAKDTVAFA